MDSKKTLSRRDFVCKCGIAASGISLFPSLLKASDIKPRRIRRSNPFVHNGKPIVVTVEGTDIDLMINKALELLGGFKKLIKSDDSVMIKPNFLGPYPYPETTHPETILKTIEMVQKTGTQRPTIVESLTSDGNNPNDTFKRFGLIEQANQRNFDLLGIDRWTAFVEFVSDPSWERLEKVDTIEPLLKTDILINMPTLKRHPGAYLTGALKNMVGCVGGQGRSALHFIGKYGPAPENKPDAMNEIIAEICHIFNPDLTIIDSRKIMINSHRFKSGGEVKDANVLIVSGNALAADLIAAGILEQYDPNFEKEMMSACFNRMATLINGPNSLKDVHHIKTKV